MDAPERLTMGLRVLHLIDSGGLYGAERMLLTLVQEQLGQGLEPMIFSAGEHGIQEKPLEAEARHLGLPLTPWRMKPGLNLRGAWRILQWAKRGRYDVLHSHGYKFNILMGVWPRRRRRIPLMCTLHGYVQAPRWTKMAAYEIFDRFMLRRADRIVIVNEAMRGILPSAATAPGRCVFIANGIAPDPPATRPLPEHLQEFVGQHRVNLIAVGRLSREKGFDRLTRVLAKSRDALRDIGIVILGEGGMRDELEAGIGSNGLDDQILLAGYQPDAASLLPHFDGLVMPSLTEGLPITILEALRARVPIIASAVGGLPAVLAAIPSARLVPPADDNALAEALHRLVKNGVTNEKTEAGAAAFCRYYTSERMAARYAAVYEELGPGGSREARGSVSHDP